MKRCVTSKTLKFLQLDDIKVPEEIKETSQETENLLEQLKEKFNIYVQQQKKNRVLTCAHV